MKIENSIFQFRPQSPFGKLQLDSLQQQYLTDLRAQDSIEGLVQKYFKIGWLVNFQALYKLVEMLVINKYVSNPEINEYFSQLEINNQKVFRSGSTAEKQSSAYSPEVLKNLPFFRSLNPKLSAFLISKATVYRYSAETLVCKTGDVSRDLFVLLKGEAAVYKQQLQTRRFVSMLSEGSLFGEAGFLLGQPRSADIITLKTSEILVVPYQAEILDQYLRVEKAQEVLKRFWVQHALFHSETFKNVPSDSLDILTFTGRLINLEDQQMLFKEGDLARHAYIVIQGSLAVQQGGKSINTLSQGAFFGEIAMMLNNGTRTATVYAQKGTVVLEFTRNEFFNLLGKNLFLAKEIQALAAKRLNADAQRAQLTAK